MKPEFPALEAVPDLTDAHDIIACCIAVVDLLSFKVSVMHSLQPAIGKWVVFRYLAYQGVWRSMHACCSMHLGCITAVHLLGLVECHQCFTWIHAHFAAKRLSPCFAMLHSLSACFSSVRLVMNAGAR